MPHPDYDPDYGRRLMDLSDRLEENLNKLSGLMDWECKLLNNPVLRKAIGFLPHDGEIIEQSKDTLVIAIARAEAMVAITRAMMNHRGVLRRFRLRALRRRIAAFPSFLRRP